MKTLLLVSLILSMMVYIGLKFFWAPSPSWGMVFKSMSQTFQPASVAQLDAPSDWRPGGPGFSPRRGRQHSFVEIDREIFSTVILPLPLIQEGQLSVSGERMWLTA